MLAENPIMPDVKNVGSKVKEILAANEKNEKIRPKQEKPMGKWDKIMSQIAEGQKRGHNIKEVKSKVFADFKPPKLIRPMLNEKRLSNSRSNSSMSSNGFIPVHSRSTSSASVASQVIIVV